MVTAPRTKRTRSVYTLIVNRIPGRHFLRNLVERRSLVIQLVRRDFQQRYHRLRRRLDLGAWCIRWCCC